MEKTLEEIRSSKEYINAFANYIKTGDDSECRALLTTNVTGGQVPVPQVVEERIRTAWENTGLMDLVRKTYVRGNVKIGSGRRDPHARRRDYDPDLDQEVDHHLRRGDGYGRRRVPLLRL